MIREQNTDAEGNAWSFDHINAVWLKGRIIPNFDQNVWRWDICGTVMNYNEHGNRTSEFGWEVDHILSVANGGNDLLYNLQPLHWNNNVAKGDNLNWKCGD